LATAENGTRGATVAVSLTGLQAELAGIDSAIEDAAEARNQEEFLTLLMRKAALPKLIRDERARPVRERVERLEGQLEDLEAERQRVLAEDFSVPPERRTDLTETLLRNQKLSGITTRSSSRVGHHLDQARRELTLVEEAW